MKKIITTLILLLTIGHANAYSLEQQNHYLANGYVQEFFDAKNLLLEQENYNLANGLLEEVFNKRDYEIELENYNEANGYWS